MIEQHQPVIKEIEGTHQQFINYDNVGLQGELQARDQGIIALQRRYVGYLTNKEKDHGITITSRNNKGAGYPYMSVYEQHEYRSHNIRGWLAHNEISTFIEEGDAQNAVVMYNTWREHRLTAINPNRERYFRLGAISCEKLLQSRTKYLEQNGVIQ